MSDMRDNSCGCGGGRPAVRIVRGNDFTVEASASVYDADKGIYVPYSLEGAEDVELNITGPYSKVAGCDAAVSGNRVSAGFTAAVGCGRYGVEVLFRDSGGRGRVFERDLFEVVDDSGDATIGSTAEGGSGEGLNVSVDLRARTVRVGQTTMATDYALLGNKPSVGGVVLEGDRTLEELGLYSREEADALLDGKADKADVPTKTSELTNDSDYATNAKVDSSVDALQPYDCTWAWRLNQGDEAPEDKVDELRKVIADKRPLYTKYTNKDGYDLSLSVIARCEDDDDTVITLTKIQNYSDRTSASWVVIDDKTNDSYVYSVVSRGGKTLQDALVSGTNIKTVNGESLLGGGDIEISLRQLTYDEREPLYAVAAKVKSSTEQYVEITEAQYNALSALPDAGLIGNILITKYIADQNDSAILYGISGVKDVDDTLYSDFAFISGENEGTVICVAYPYSPIFSPLRSVRLTANADGTLTADTAPSELTGYDKALSSFPVMIVHGGNYKNNVRCYVAQDVQTMKSDSSYSDTIQTVFLSLNGVYYKWVGTTLTPVRSAVGQTPVVYTFAANDDGTFDDVGKDDIGRFSLIDELEFKAANPTKSNLMVKVVSGGVSYWLSDISHADGVITCKGYIPQDRTMLTLAITSDGKVSMTRAEAVDAALSGTSENPVQNKAVKAALDGKVDKVEGKGLSSNDYTDADKAKVDSALQEYTETDPTVPDWAKTPTKPTYTAKEVGALPDTTRIPSKVSELENDSKYITEQSLDGYAKTADIPTKTSELTNDSGFLTEHQDLSGKQDTLVSGTNIKTVNGESVLGEGDIPIDLGGCVKTEGDELAAIAALVVELNARISALEGALREGLPFLAVDNLQVRNSLDDYSTKGNANLSGEGAPAVIADKAGQRYLDATNNVWYTSTGNTAVSQWKQDTNS